ncbi:MAG: protein kinase [Pirellulaceae bacterium]|nr:protein kinase [Pirellulaceae bacterium]
MDRKLDDHEILEAIIEQFTTQLRAGEFPSIAHYQQQYPELAEEIHELLSSIAIIEQLKSASETRTELRHSLDSVQHLKRIGNYKILHEIGRGGMGVVFAAVHESLGRQVAIKVLPTPLLDGSKHVQRFKREAQSAARLHHTNIVSVYGAGEGEGFHYYVMDFVNGHSLSTVIADLRRASQAAAGESTSSQPADTAFASLRDPAVRYRWAATVAAQLSDALEYAHSADILHRDIKPANILLDQRGAVWITDFGLAKDGSQAEPLTRTGDVVGTPQYMPPESLEGKYDRRSETYAVGLVLYELVTLQPAFSGSSPAELIRAIAGGSSPSIRKSAQAIPSDLATLIDKAIAREPQLRYQSAAELKQDLLAFVQDRPISARRPSVLESLRRWSRRNPLSASLSAVSAALLVLVAATASIGYWSTTKALDEQAEISRSLLQQKTETDSARHQAEENLVQMRAQYDRAESNVALTLTAFEEMFKQLIARGNQATVESDLDTLRELSGVETSLTRQDAEFLDRMVAFYEKFAALNADNERLALESARAYRRVGNIYQLVAQVEPAIEAYEKSLRLLPTAGADAAAEKDLLLARVQTQNELATAQRRAGKHLVAQETNQRSIELLEQSPAIQQDRELRLELARTLSAMGFNYLLLMNAQRPPRPPPPPERLAQRNSDAPEVSADSDRPARLDVAFDPPAGGPPNFDRPGGPGGRRRPGVAGEFGGPDSPRPIGPAPLDPLNLGPPRPGSFGAGQSGPGFNGPGGPGQAGSIDRVRRAWERHNSPYNDRAIEILDRLVQEDPENAEYLSVRASCYLSLAAANFDEDRQIALKQRDLAVQALQQLVERQPQSSEFRFLLALACGLVPQVQDAQDWQLLSRGAELAGQLTSQHPTTPDYHHVHANLKIKQASYLIRDQQLEPALAALRDARSALIQLRSQTNSDRSFIMTDGMLVREMQQLLRAFREHGDSQQATQIDQMLQQLRKARREPAR